KLWSSRLERVREIRSPAGRRLRIEEHRGARHVWRDILKQLEILRAHCRFDICEPGNVATRFCETLNKFFTEGIGDIGEHDRDYFGLLRNRTRNDGRMRNDYIWIEFDQLRCKDSRAFRGRCPPPVPDAQVFVRPPQLLKSLLECVNRSLA